MVWAAQLEPADRVNQDMLTPLSDQQWDLFKAAHLINRAGFGGTPETIANIYKLGPARAVDLLLAADTSKDDQRFPAEEFAQLTDARESMQELREFRRSQQSGDENASRRMIGNIIRDRAQSTHEMTVWWLKRMASTHAPLAEKMALFWHGHFATSVQKVKQPYLMYQQNELFRDEGLGNFGDLTKAITRDPAMMVYLDVQRSRKGEPNENFAREIMELFTMGEGNYTEADIREAARAFTGYRIDRRTGQFQFVEFAHDSAPKTVLGQSNLKDGDDVIDAILRQNVTSEFIAAKIWEFFAYENPSLELVRQIAHTFRANRYELQPLLREILRSQEFFSERAIRSQIKSPIVWLVNTSLILETEMPETRFLRNILDSLGQRPFFPPNVKGWDGGRAWINSSTLLLRYNLAGLFLGDIDSAQTFLGGSRASQIGDPNMEEMAKRMERRLASRGLGVRADLEAIAPCGTRDDLPKMLNNLAFRLFQAPLTAKQAQVFGAYWIEKKDLAEDDRLAGLIHLMMSTPEYQLI